jgi:predicted aspartyl protease
VGREPQGAEYAEVAGAVLGEDAALCRPAEDRRPPDESCAVDSVMVDTGSKYTWLPATLLAALCIARVKPIRFVAAAGRILERDTGYALIGDAGQTGPTVVVFALAGDQTLLGAHALEGMNLQVDLVNRVLIPARPVPAAAAA